MNHTCQKRTTHLDRRYAFGVDYILVHRYQTGYVRHYLCATCGAPIGLNTADRVVAQADDMPDL